MINPFYVIKNIDETNSFSLAQNDFYEHRINLNPGHVINFHWPNKALEEFMILSFIESASNALQTDWSRKFKIDTPGQFTIKCQKSNSIAYRCG